MRFSRGVSALGLGALGAAGFLASPALQAQENRLPHAVKRQFASVPGGIGLFTPAAADPKLAAVLARSGLPDSDFRFTPSESRRSGSGAVTVAVRARSTRSTPSTPLAVSAPTVSLAPIAYNLGVSVGWKRFAVAGDVARVELLTQPGSRERADVGLSYTGKRVSGRVQAAADRPLANTPVLIGDNPSYSIDVGGSYSLTRRLAVTAGVRYKTERDRLPRLTDDRRDSQSVYVGTAFRF
ncbi:MAG: hypothetical protein WDN44_07885 [Sphingomonas sp.]